MLFSYSRADGSVLRYDIPASEVRGRDPLAADGISAPSITAAGDAWAVVDATDGDVWLRGADAAVSDADDGCGDRRPAGSRRARRSISPTRPPSCGCPPTARRSTTEVGDGAGVLGTPAQPTVHDGEVFAAWLPQGTQDGVLWSSRDRPVRRSTTARGRCGDQRRPAFVASDDAVILNETRSGWVWTVPDGELVAVEPELVAR